MPKIYIQAGASFPFDVAKQGKYLIIRSLTKSVMLESDSFRGLSLDSGDAVDVSEFGAMRFENNHAEAVSIDYQISDLKVQTQAMQNIVVQRIIDPIQFEASVRVEDGLKIELIASSRLSSAPDMTLQAGEVKRVTSNASNRKQTLIQVLSDSPTLLRVGAANVAANIGAVLHGSISAPASTVIDSSADVYLFNASDSSAKVSVTEVLF
ncbi:hypothetical protein F0249_19130 [Vibrio sp. 03-59-1]|uniref:hypothetical protein n=1 Tax=Vibrio sp. 03-59-1 TaxID=2607607 RepID=UPI00149347F1|nr:hypothetical protein [Vibrio sp. 03-59-1]NOH85903.1 hypothetical protein [Vibrio sp. 03-59-1]